MKTRFDKAKIMREANRLMKYEGFNRSQALRLAWSTAKRNEFYQIVEKWERVESNLTIREEMNLLANSLINYYSVNGYHGD